MEYRVIETAIQTKVPLAGKILAFLFGGFFPRLQPRPLQFELETILNQLAQQGYFLVSQQMKAGRRGYSEAIIFIFARDKANLPHQPNDEVDWESLKTRRITD